MLPPDEPLHIKYLYRWEGLSYHKLDLCSFIVETSYAKSAVVTLILNYKHHTRDTNRGIPYIKFKGLISFWLLVKVENLSTEVFRLINYSNQHFS